MEPTASKYRPSTLEDYIGQSHLVGKSKPIETFIEQGKIPSMVFWGPPGTGKTTLAYIISKSVNADFHKLSAVMSGKDHLKKIIASAMLHQKSLTLEGPKPTILFLDEIHRWNKSQQDALLPYVEKGLVTLIGATTENPSFSLVPALLSRVRVFTFEKHSEEDVKKYLGIILRKLKEQDNITLNLNEKIIQFIAETSDGDLRTSSNVLDSILLYKNPKPRTEVTVSDEELENLIEKFLQYESRGEDHYNIISAVHKSLRGSDPDAGVYWVTRMLEAGDDPLYIARRLVRFASEDIGNADPNALVLANAVFDTCKNIGKPECDVALIQLAIYLARAPKSIEAYKASNLAKEDVKKFGSLPVPLHIRNAPTDLMKDLGYGKGYKYNPDYEGKVEQDYLPDKLKGKKYVDDKN